MDTNRMISPFTLINGCTTLVLKAGKFKEDIFYEHAGRSSTGYGWEALAKVFINKYAPHLKKYIEYDSTEINFCAYSDNIRALEEFAIAFYVMCEDQIMFEELLNEIRF